MIPVGPTISIRSLSEADSTHLASLIGEAIGSTPYSTSMDEEAVRREIFVPNPPTVYPIRWQRHLHLGAWRAGQLVGFVDAAVGLDRDSLDLPDYHPHGLIRFLALPQRADLIDEVVDALFARLQVFWRNAGVGYVKAFHISTGYPSFQAGAGLLPGDWPEHFRVLTMSGFKLYERYYCLYRVLDHTIEEVVPLAQLSMVQRQLDAEREYNIYYRRTDWIGRARVVRVKAQTDSGPLYIAYMTDLQIEEGWRRQSLGRLLLRRLINDATLQGYHQMVVHLAHQQYMAQNLLVQHGFQELNYRGYSLDKALTD
jgi:ribosomal protein S18 acetylase RimI-like enzyme